MFCYWSLGFDFHKFLSNPLNAINDWLKPVWNERYARITRLEVCNLQFIFIFHRIASKKVDFLCTLKFGFSPLVGHQRCKRRHLLSRSPPPARRTIRWNSRSDGRFWQLSDLLRFPCWRSSAHRSWPWYCPQPSTRARRLVRKHDWGEQLDDGRVTVELTMTD